MDKKMFCFQCEQTVGCAGCTGNAGVCGKKADTARLQDELTGALIGLARAVDSTTAISKRTGQVIIALLPDICQRVTTKGCLPQLQM